MSLASVTRALERDLAGRVLVDRPLAPLTTYRLGGPAAVLVEPASPADVATLARLLPPEVDVLPLGRGSNLVVSDRGWPGVVVRLGPAFARIHAVGGSGRTRGLEAGAGTPLPTVANWAARRALAGLEFLVAIPGSVGGAVRMNAGAHDGSIDRSLLEVRVVELGGGDIRTRPAADLGLAYRRSTLGDRTIVLGARFGLTSGDAEVIRQRMDSFRRHRSATQPGALQNAGSVFKNPPGDAAGRLVEAAGLKGFSVGRASVSELHANFFVASDGARAQDVYDLVRAVRARVRAASGVDLEPEIRFAGHFEDTRAEVPT
jgi:UDP-N-acetylmuramate dehydrogenase